MLNILSCFFIFDLKSIFYEKHLFTTVFTTHFSQLQVSAFYPTFGASGNYFGRKVEINNNEVVVSSGFNNSFNQLGKVYVFDFTNNNLIQTDVLIESDVSWFLS